MVFKVERNKNYSSILELYQDDVLISQNSKYINKLLKYIIKIRKVESK